jgi:hypothetical protein
MYGSPSKNKTVVVWPEWEPVPYIIIGSNPSSLKIARQTTEIDIDEKDLRSGDYLAILRLDGLDPMIMYGTGSHSGHTTTVLFFDGEPYIVES